MGKKCYAPNKKSIAIVNRKTSRLIYEFFQRFNVQGSRPNHWPLKGQISALRNDVLVITYYTTDSTYVFHMFTS